MTLPTHFKAPSDEEIIEAFKKQHAKILEWKAATVILVGISREPKPDDLKVYPINYSIARFGLDLKHVWKATQAIREKHSNYTQYMQNKKYQFDDTGNIVWQEVAGHQVPKVYVPNRNKDDAKPLYESYKDVPSEIMGEASSPDSAINPEQVDFGSPEAIESEKLMQTRYPWYVNWFKKSPENVFVFRQPTGKFFSSEEASLQGDVEAHQKLIIAEMTQTIRRIFWTINPPFKAGRLPLDQVSGSEIHNLIFERLKTAKAHQRVVYAEQGNLEDNYQDYLVAIASPIGVSRLYSSIDEALTDLSRFIQQQLEELIVPKEPLMKAATISKTDAVFLLRTAEICDKQCPTISAMIDKVFFDPRSNNPEIDSQVFVNSLIRVANQLDEAGQTVEATLADRLISSIVEEEQFSKIRKN